jgi:hypothetical protein
VVKVVICAQGIGDMCSRKGDRLCSRKGDMCSE